MTRGNKPVKSSLAWWSRFIFLSLSCYKDPLLWQFLCAQYQVPSTFSFLSVDGEGLGCFWVPNTTHISFSASILDCGGLIILFLTEAKQVPLSVCVNDGRVLLIWKEILGTKQQDVSSICLMTEINLHGKAPSRFFVFSHLDLGICLHGKVYRRPVQGRFSFISLS